MGMIEASNEMNEKFNALNATMEILSKKIDTVLATKEKETENKHETNTTNVTETSVNTKETKKVKKPRKSKSDHIAWIGSSISNAMDLEKFEQDTKTNVTFVKAYGIKEDIESTYPKEAQRFPDKTFKKIVPDVIEKNDVDILVMQAGSIEISNMKVNEALMDTSKDYMNTSKIGLIK